MSGILTNIKAQRGLLTGPGLAARVRRSSIWSFLEFGGGQGLRLLSNLILTRLLLPEAFGLMALVSVVILGLALFSDTGVQPLIAQNQKGDEQSFLDTAWTVQVVRGFLLWLMISIAAIPVASLYNEPLLAQVLPVAGVTLAIDGMKPVSVHSLARHLALGRLVAIKLSSQFVGLIALVSLAWELESVWALVIGNVITALLTTSAYYIFIRAPRSQLILDKSALREIFGFGKWIFLSTAAGFIVNQSDRAILGLHVNLDVLGVYNVGYFLASLPILLGFAAHNNVMLPLYRMKSPLEGDENRNAIFFTRRTITFFLIAIAVFLSFAGPTIVDLLYDDRYRGAGGIITLFSLSVVPLICLNSITTALIGLGNPRAMFFVIGVTAVVQTALMFIGIQSFGVPGALLSPGLAVLATYPLRLAYSIRYRVFDPLQDLGMTLLGIGLVLLACMFNCTAISSLFAIPIG